jgi:hypothetical protein
MNFLESWERYAYCSGLKNLSSKEVVSKVFNHKGHKGNHQDTQSITIRFYDTLCFFVQYLKILCGLFFYFNTASAKSIIPGCR